MFLSITLKNFPNLYNVISAKMIPTSPHPVTDRWELSNSLKLVVSFYCLFPLFLNKLSTAYLPLTYPSPLSIRDRWLTHLTYKYSLGRDQGVGWALLALLTIFFIYNIK